MELKNYEMFNHLLNLQKVSSKVTGKLGYAVSRNIRKIQQEVIEFEKIRNELVVKFGEKQENGDFVISKDSDGYTEFVNTIQEYGTISHNVEIFTVLPDEVCESNLTAEEMLLLDFMINE